MAPCSSQEEGWDEGRVVPFARALAIFAVLVLAFFGVPQWILTELTGTERGVRVWLVTGWAAAAFFGASYAAWRTSGPARGPDEAGGGPAR